MSFTHSYAHLVERWQAWQQNTAVVMDRGPDKLQPMRMLLNALDNPQQTYQIVHVAGTNGKGMTSLMVARLLQAEPTSGQFQPAVGCYTSPHLMCYTERIAINGKPVSQQWLAPIGHRVLDVAEQMSAARATEQPLTFFDLFTATALEAFRQAKLQWVVLETGLGGVSDSTNATSKALSIISTIGKDHMAILGANLKSIASQKLGIVRSGIPTVLGTQPPMLQHWMQQQLQQRGSPCHLADEWALRLSNPSVGQSGQRLQIKHHGQWVDVALEWPEQQKQQWLTLSRLRCASMAVAAMAVLTDNHDWHIICQRLQHTLMVEAPARLEYRSLSIESSPSVLLSTGKVSNSTVAISKAPQPALILDGAHNAAALRMLLKQLQQWHINQYGLVFALGKDKCHASLLPPLKTLLKQTSQLLLPQCDNPRLLPPAHLKQWLCNQLGTHPLPPIGYGTNPHAALANLIELYPHTPVVVTGSFLMLGELYPHLASS